MRDVRESGFYTESETLTEVLSKTLGSIEFTDKFTSELNKELAAQGEAAREIDQICSDMTEIINRAWEERTRDW